MPALSTAAERSVSLTRGRWRGLFGQRFTLDGARAELSGTEAGEGAIERSVTVHKRGMFERGMHRHSPKEHAHRRSHGRDNVNRSGGSHCEC